MKPVLPGQGQPRKQSSQHRPHDGSPQTFPTMTSSVVILTVTSGRDAVPLKTQCSPLALWGPGKSTVEMWSWLQVAAKLVLPCPLLFENRVPRTGCEQEPGGPTPPTAAVHRTGCCPSVGTNQGWGTGLESQLHKSPAEATLVPTYL